MITIKAGKIEKQVDLMDFKNYFKEKNIFFRNNRGNNKSILIYGINLNKLMNILKIKYKLIQIIGSDGYTVLYERDVEGVPYLGLKEKHSESIVFAIKDNEDGRFFVNNVEHLNIFNGKITKVKTVTLDFNSLPFQKIKIGNKMVEGISLLYILKLYQVKGDYIEFFSDDNYHAIFDINLLKNAHILREKRKMVALSLRYGNWIKFVKKIMGKNVAIEFK